MRKEIINTLFIFTVMFNKALNASTYHVAPHGDDGYSVAEAKNTMTPWRTISKAAGVVTAGDSIVIHDGLYTESKIQFTHSGEKNGWIVVTAAPGSHPEITGSGRWGFYIHGDKSNRYSKSHFYISGLTLHGYQEDAICIYYADYLIFDHIHAYDNGNTGINAMGSNHIMIQNCELHHNGWKPDGDSGWGDGASINNREFIDGSEKWFSVIRKNIMYANWQKREGSYWDGNGFTWDLAGTGGAHIMANNIFFNNGGSGILNNNTGNMAIQHNVLFRNMSDYNRCRNMGEFYLIEQWVDNTFIKNNIIYGRRRTAKYSELIPIILEDAANTGNEIIENNLIWSELEWSTEIYWHNFMLLQQWNNSVAPTTITGDPGFISAPFDDDFTTFHGSEWINMDINQYDFNLQKKSQCIDQGDWLTKTTSGGSGKNIPVESARFFTDGFGFPNQGDLIQVGADHLVRITDIDYENNTITVEHGISWNSGDGLSFPYEGSHPDIGAIEFQPMNSLLAEAIVSPVSGHIPFTAQFTGKATGGETGYTFQWDFGDGTNSSIQNPSHQYQNIGDFQVIFSVIDNMNSVAKDTLQINVYDNTPPNAPTNLYSPTQTDSSIQMNWQTPVQAPDGETATFYQIFRDGELIQTTQGTSYLDNNNLRENTVYQYGIYAVDRANNLSPYPVIAKFWTLEKLYPYTDPPDTNFCATVTVYSKSPWDKNRIPIRLETSQSVIQVPTPLILVESDQTETMIQLEGDIPGQTFTGFLMLSPNVSEGNGYFYLGQGSLIDHLGNVGSTQCKGDSIHIDKTAPAVPTIMNISLK